MGEIMGSDSLASCPCQMSLLTYHLKEGRTMEKEMMVVLRDEEYQQIAAEFNLSETAFPIPTDGNFQTASKFTLRWFHSRNGGAVVRTCHARLFSCFVSMKSVCRKFRNLGSNNSSTITFATKSGDLIVKRGARKLVEMDFPQYAITAIQFHTDPSPLARIFPEFHAPPHLPELIHAFIPKIIRIEAVAYASAAKKLIIVIDKETTNFELSEITSKRADRMVKLDPEGEFTRGVIVTLAPTPAHAKSQGFVDAEAEPYDYVCRYFAPWVGIMEDPATGSAQCALGPFGERYFKSAVYMPTNRIRSVEHNFEFIYTIPVGCRSWASPSQFYKVKSI
ncbi:phenazine biosynthesis protein, PhzF family [Cooperia oncophora]